MPKTTAKPESIQAHRLAGGWSIRLGDTFQKRKEAEEELLFSTGDKSVRVVIWSTDKSKEAVYQECMAYIRNSAQISLPTALIYELSDPETLRIGYKIVEWDEQKSYEVIHAYVIADGSFVQLAFYFDHSSDEAWALEVWKGVKAGGV